MKKKIVAILELDCDNEELKANGLKNEMGWVAESGIYLMDYCTDEQVAEQVEKLINKR